MVDCECPRADGREHGELRVLFRSIAKDERPPYAKVRSECRYQVPARGHRKRLESADLCEVVRNATRWLVRDMKHERITLRLDLPPQALRVRANHVQLEQILVNLIQNAIDAICEAGNETRESRIRTSQTEDGMAEVAVDDADTSFPAAAAERLYEPFFTTKRGMGMAISRSIVEMHGGRLSVGPHASGAGTTVRLVPPIDSVPGTEEGSQ